MSRINIKPGAGGKVVNGMRPEHDFTVTFTPTTQTYPARQYDVVARDLTVTYYEHAYTTNEEMRIDVGGNTKGLSIKLMPPPGVPSFVDGYQLVGNIVRKITSNDEGFYARIKTEYGERDVFYQYTGNPPGLNDFKTSGEVEYKHGTFARECVDNMKSSLPPAGASNEDNCQFKDGGTYDLAGVQVQDNTQFFLRQYDWSGISLAKTGAGYAFPLVLVSPQHAVFATHVNLTPVGSQATFVRPDGTMQTVTVQAAVKALDPDSGTYVEGSPDLTVVLFDQPVTGCSVFKLIPPDFELYMPVDNMPDGSNLSTIWSGVVGVARMSNPGEGSGINGNIKLMWNSPKFIAQIFSPYSTSKAGMLSVFKTKPTDTLVASHWRAPYSGDSGSPYFVLARDGADPEPSPILLSVLYGISLVTASGPHLGRWFDWLQQQMDAMSTQAGAPLHKLKKPDLSRYTTFP